MEYKQESVSFLMDAARQLAAEVANRHMNDESIMGIVDYVWRAIEAVQAEELEAK